MESPVHVFTKSEQKIRIIKNPMKQWRNKIARSGNHETTFVTRKMNWKRAERFYMEDSGGQNVINNSLLVLEPAILT